MPQMTLNPVEHDSRFRARWPGYAAAVRTASWPGDPLEPHVSHELHRQLQVDEQRYDFQTGLLSQESFQEALAALVRRRPADQEISLLWIEILNLRREFTLHGAKETETLIRSVAEELRPAAASAALVGRFSGDCFLVAFETAKQGKSSRRQMQELADTLASTRVPGSHAQPEVAAGVAFCPSDTESSEDLVRFASLAASRAAYSRSASVMAFHADMNHHIIREHMLETEMSKGLDRGEFRMVYQPKVALANGHVLGAEALIRWDHPRWGSIAPSEFIPIAERSHLIHRIFDLTLRTALKDAQRWRDQGLSLPLIAVNASAVNLRRDDFVRTVRALLAEFPIAPTKLEIELTESTLFDDEELFTRRVQQLKAMGVRVAIDDFGTRYTGFNMLKDLPLDVMKIDRCFIHGIDRSVQLQALCRTIVAMARQLKLRTVAEGVEEPAELEVLRECGCDAGQGYLFQRPVPAEQLAVFLSQWPERMESLN